MFLPKVFIQGLFLAGLQSHVVGLSIPNESRDILHVDADVVLLGPPDLIQVEKLDARDAESEAEVVELLPRALTADATEALRLHNAARKKKNLKALVWDTTLQADALKWAKSEARKGKMEHSSGDQRPGQGENLAYAYSSGKITNPLTQATNLWLAEASKYKGQKIPDGDFAGYGHYTQIMWKSTTKVGIASASDGKGSWYTVARYSPPGNYAGQKPY